MTTTLIAAISEHLGTLVQFDEVWMILRVIDPATGEVQHSVALSALLMYFKTTLDANHFFNILGCTDDDLEITFDNFMHRAADHNFNQATKGDQGQNNLPKPLYCIMNDFLDSKMEEPILGGHPKTRAAWFSVNPAFAIEKIRKRALVRPDETGTYEQRESYHRNKKMCELMKEEAKAVKLLLDNGCIGKMTLRVDDSSRNLTEPCEMITGQFPLPKKCRKRPGTSDGGHGQSPRSMRLSWPVSALGLPPTTAPGSPAISEVSIGSRAGQYSEPGSPDLSRVTLAAILGGADINDLADGYVSANSPQVSELSMEFRAREYVGSVPPGDTVATQIDGHRSGAKPYRVVAQIPPPDSNWTAWAHDGSQQMAMAHRHLTCIEESEMEKRDRELRAVLNKRSPPQPQSRPMVVPQSKQDIANEKRSELQRKKPENAANEPEHQKNDIGDLDNFLEQLLMTDEAFLNNAPLENLSLEEWMYGMDEGNSKP